MPAGEGTGKPMPTTRRLSPHRVLPRVPTILFLVLGVVTVFGVAPDPVFPTGGSGHPRFERHALPVNSGDDFLQTGLPVSFPDDDESGRKLRAVQVPREREIPAKTGISRPCDSSVTRFAVDSLMDSLVLSRPPPAGYPGA